MQNLLMKLVGIKRYNKKGKENFIREIRKWSEINLNSYKFKTEKSLLVLNIYEFIKLLFLIFNFTLLIYIVDELGLPDIIQNGVIIIFMYGIQFRLIFLFLSILIPSQNIIISKEAEIKSYNTQEIIICAHYDTKNSLSKRKKGRMKSFIKYNVFNISRALSGLVSKIDKAVLPISAIVYSVYLLWPGKVLETASIFDYPEIGLMFFSAIIGILFFYGLVCALIIYVLTMPFGSEIKNPGADDNTSGVVGALEVARRLNDVKLDTNLKIILFDNEERGLIGSTHFVTQNYRRLKENAARIINFDCIGRGKDLYILTDNIKNNLVVDSVKSELIKKNVKYEMSNIDFSDHKPFSRHGIDSLSFGRYNGEKYLWLKKFPVIDWIHGSEDTPEEIEVKKIEEIVEVVTEMMRSNYGTDV